ncbi:MAG TPA: endolytic transglycosylase MltG [Flavobacteriaceae bacterium]|nr:endolytic transglycosylase MltG [Flavobacteriaceae bacterium]
MNFSKKNLILIFISTLLSAFILYIFIWKSNVSENGRIIVTSDVEINQIVASADSYLKNPFSLKIMLYAVELIKPIKPGSYRLEEGMNNITIIRILIIGRQSPINLTFNNQDTLEKLAGRIAMEMEFDSISLLDELKKIEYLKSDGFNKETVLSVFIPNSYEIYWNISPEKFINKMLTEYQNFWNEERIEKATKLNLTPIQVQILASIVQKETTFIAERPIVAGLYLNRIKADWPLQADPTIVFSIKQKTHQDTVIKRVLKKHLLIDSPYNTYKNTGLPPGLISMPDISSIDAVLNAPKHDYFYMCASSEKIGSHLFATTLAEHNRNASKYQKWLNQQGINK